ncbi:hypothetical protein Tdes44962_MAKER02805 [Teratosphaeria destructans]|uniref:Uncharacterized protein n=1 Tax=Teratosphaeria destructans TaxID=418781 RepID=A0A9W7SS46_9PEZI|nr:hypothetical protein Tdes44962_MAKER02805 [Teratosphaeria destructans]
MVPLPTFAHVACDQSLNTAAAELKYTQSTHLVNILAKDEDIRRLRFDIHILEDDNDELRELLLQEEDRSDTFQKLVDENLRRAEVAEARLSDAETDLRGREQELATALAEIEALKASGEDATVALTEKLALTRELNMLKPELEHLKAQAANTEALMTEKLALQRQVSEIQCSLENAQRQTQRALAKRRNTGVEIAQEEQMEDLRRQLAKEKRARQRAEEAANVTQADVNVDDVRKELAREKRLRQQAEEKLEEASQATQVEDVRKDLLKEKKMKQKLEDAIETLKVELEHEKKAAARAVKRADGIAEADDQAEELRQELAKEKKERAKAEKIAQQTADEWQSQKTTLDDKLNQFRNKLRTTKERLKQAEAQLAANQAAEAAEVAVPAPAPVPNKATAATKNTNKRTAAHLEADASTLGTPGDRPAAKRGRKAAAGVGDKSTFSITPFLNKTMSAASEDGEDEQNDASDIEASPVVAKKQTKQVLAEKTASKANVPVAKKAPVQRKRQAAPALASVAEGDEDVHSQGQENANGKPAAAAAAGGMKIKTKLLDGSEHDNPDLAKKKKIRKSLVDFASFNPEPEVQRKKKRKLGGLGKTLFDEEEDAAAPPAKSGFMAVRGLLGAKGLGGGFGKKIGSSFVGSTRPGSTLLVTAVDGSGFQFSPLKKQRRGLDDTLRG